jgi:hypothetical protein
MCAATRILLSSPLPEISDHTCDAPKSPCTRERCDGRSSITLIRRGGDPHRVHHLSRDAEFLIELPQSVEILSIRSSLGFLGGTGK